MGAVPKKSDSGEDNDLAVQENVLWEQKGVEHMVVAGGQGLASSEEEESRINEANRHNNNGLEGGIQVSSGTQKFQSQGSVIHWERFLPIRSLKVLLVENDDSTRHVVSAFLRNCSYEEKQVISA